MICLQRLSEIVSLDIDKLLNALPITVRRSHRSYSGKCWVHGGDNYHAMSIYEREGVYKWSCKSRHCEQTFNSSIIGFTRGVLSRENEGWERPGDRLYSFPKTIEFLKSLYGLSNSNLQIDLEAIEKKKFRQATASLEFNGYKPICTREEYLSRVSVPSKYFLGRGFSEDVLTKYDAGDYNEPRSKLHSRSLFPIFCDDRKFVIGVSGRVRNDWQLPKWCHSDFNIGCCLFNYWFSREYIKKTKQVILVEGPCDILRLEEAGIHNGVALFGGALTVSRQFKLDSLGVGEIVLLTDEDKAGNGHAKKIIEDCSNYYNIRQIHLPAGQDPGSMQVQELQTLLKDI